jgi:hypothetical protein
VFVNEIHMYLDKLESTNMNQREYNYVGLEKASQLQKQGELASWARWETHGLI